MTKSMTEIISMEGGFHPTLCYRIQFSCEYVDSGLNVMECTHVAECAQLGAEEAEQADLLGQEVIFRGVVPVTCFL